MKAAHDSPATDNWWNTLSATTSPAATWSVPFFPPSDPDVIAR